MLVASSPESATENGLLYTASVSSSDGAPTMKYVVCPCNATGVFRTNSEYIPVSSLTGSGKSGLTNTPNSWSGMTGAPVEALHTDSLISVASYCSPLMNRE